MLATPFFSCTHTGNVVLFFVTTGAMGLMNRATITCLGSMVSIAGFFTQGLAQLYFGAGVPVKYNPSVVGVKIAELLK